MIHINFYVDLVRWQRTKATLKKKKFSVRLKLLNKKDFETTLWARVGSIRGADTYTFLTPQMRNVAPNHIHNFWFWKVSEISRDAVVSWKVLNLSFRVVWMLNTYLRELWFVGTVQKRCQIVRTQMSRYERMWCTLHFLINSGTQSLSSSEFVY